MPPESALCASGAHDGGGGLAGQILKVSADVVTPRTRKHPRILRAAAETGRQDGLRIRWSNPWGFESPAAHHLAPQCAVGQRTGEVLTYLAFAMPYIWYLYVSVYVSVRNVCAHRSRERG